MRADHKTRFKSGDNATDLAKQATGVKLPKDIDAAIRAMPVSERSVWLRKIITEAAVKELMQNVECKAS